MNPLEYCTTDKTVAVEPIMTSIEKEVRHGVAIAKQKVALIKTKVVFAPETTTIGSGDYVFLRGDIITMPYAKEVFEVDGKQFILVPLDAVQLIHFVG